MAKYIAFASDRYGTSISISCPLPAARPGVSPFTPPMNIHTNSQGTTRSIIFGAARMDVAGNRDLSRYLQPELYQVSVDGGRGAAAPLYSCGRYQAEARMAAS